MSLANSRYFDGVWSFLFSSLIQMPFSGRRMSSPTGRSSSRFWQASMLNLRRMDAKITFSSIRAKRWPEDHYSGTHTAEILNVIHRFKSITAETQESMHGDRSSKLQIKPVPFLPMQLRSPAEKGMYAYGGLPTEFSGRKRSGLNSSGSGKYRGSRWRL